MITVTLPWPAKALHPNARVHWGAKASATKRARADAYTLARCEGFAFPGVQQWISEGRLYLHIDGYPPDRRKRDADGLLASLKSAIDGIADALGIDDSRFIPCPMVMSEVRKGGQVVIRIHRDTEQP